MLRIFLNVSIFLGTWVLLSQCKGKDNKILDLSSSNVEININRFDKKFQAIDTNNLLGSLHKLRNEDSTFFDTYTTQMMRFGKLMDTASLASHQIDLFLSNKYNQYLFDSVNLHFRSLAPLEKELSSAFKYFHHYFPSKPIPKVHSVLSGFGYNAVTFDSATLVLALEMYLGKNFSVYKSIDLPKYKTARFSQEYMVPNAMEVMYSQYFGKNMLDETDALIYEMIEKGKKLYFLECMMPKKEKHLLIGFSKEQLTWCKKAATDIWAFYNEKDLFYSKSYMEHKKHIEDSPKTAGMPKEAPGNVGSWVGWQIVNAYMQNANGAVSLEKLLDTPAETILAKSKYKP